MMVTRAYLRLSSGERQEVQVKLTEQVEEGVHALFIDGLSDRALDPEFGAGIELYVEGVKRWMADYRHSEYWCRLEFGTDCAFIPDETQGLIYEKADGGFGVVLPVVS